VKNSIIVKSTVILTATYAFPPVPHNLSILQHLQPLNTDVRDAIKGGRGCLSRLPVKKYLRHKFGELCALPKIHEEIVSELQMAFEFLLMEVVRCKTLIYCGQLCDNAVKYAFKLERGWSRGMDVAP
jgi:hypothetical protein